MRYGVIFAKLNDNGVFLRYILFIGTFLTFFLLSIYGVLFTPGGNKLLTPYLQMQLQRISKQDITIRDFRLTSTQLTCNLLVDNNSSIELKGAFSLLDIKEGLHYSAVLKDIKFKNFRIKDEMHTNGILKGDYNLLTIDGESSFLDGMTHYIIQLQKTNDALLYNSDVKVSLHKVSSLKILHILNYPALFNAKVNGDFIYNIQTQKGDGVLHFLNGKFIKNALFDTLRTYTRANLYDEMFQGVMKAQINRELLQGSFHVVSEQSVVEAQHFSLDMNRRMIDSNISVSVDNYPVYTTIIGKINQPTISFDLQKTINSKTGEMIKKSVENFFKSLF